MCWNLLLVLAWQLWVGDAYSRRSHFICGYLVRSFLVVPCQYPGFQVLALLMTCESLNTSPLMILPTPGGLRALFIFLMILQSKVTSLGSKKSSLGSLFFLPFVWPSPPLQPDPWCWPSFSESTVCSLAHSYLALVTPVLFHSYPLTLADTPLNSFWGLSRTVSL